VDRIKSIHEDPLLQYFKDDNSHFDLAPAFIEVKDENGNDNPKYGPVKDIANKLGNRNVKNIALTGPYGAGKSSVLQTLMRDYRKANYLCISLATLEDDTLYKELIEKDKNTNEEANKQMVPAVKSKANNNQKTIDKDAINHLIEYSILQQIIYKEKAHKLRQSRLKRIQDIKWKKALPISASLIVAVIAAIVLFMPNFIMVDSLCEVFSCSKRWKQIWDVICMLYIIIISIYILSYIIVSTYNSKINKLNFKN
jgi:dephospho-CoA kinase